MANKYRCGCGSRRENNNSYGCLSCLGGRYCWDNYPYYGGPCPDRDGCYAMMDQTWTVTMDGRLSTENRSGQVVMRVDDEGEIEWVRIFRMSQTGTASELPMVHYRWVMTDRGPMLVWAETKKSADYADNEPVIGFVPFSTAGVLTAAIIDSDGNITRQHWPLAAKTGLQGRPTMMENGDWLLLLRGKTKGHLATLKVK